VLEEIIEGGVDLGQRGCVGGWDGLWKTPEMMQLLDECEVIAKRRSRLEEGCNTGPESLPIAQYHPDAALNECWW